MEQVTENCISLILSFTTPLDTCRSSGVSTEFRSAADSDELWNNFLPPDLSQILSRSLPTLTYNTKRQLYFLLCDSPVLLDDGNVSFSLDKTSGKKCFMLAARRLLISWGDTPSYWSWASNYKSRFSEVAVLQYVWWLCIRGKMKTGMLSPHTTYEAYLIFKLYENAYGLESAKTSIRFVSEREDVPSDEAITVYPDTRSSAYNSEQRNGEVSWRRKDGWMEIKTGEFETGTRDDDEVETRFMSIEGQVKGGLIVQADFRSAADSDELWNKFLPSDLSQILSRSLSTLAYNTKRELYFLLCDSPVLLDDGNVSFSLDKKSGKKCFMVAARQLSISWGDTPTYWIWSSNYNSRFSEVAVLQYVWWLDIRGRMETGLLSPHTTYETYLVYKLHEDARGLNSARTSIRFVNEIEEVPSDETNIVYPDTRTSAANRPNTEQRNGEVSRRRKDGWMEIKTGEFETGARDDDEVETRFMSTGGYQVKAGLIVQGIEFRPKQS